LCTFKFEHNQKKRTHLIDMVLPELESGLPACLYGTKHAQAQAGAGRHRIGQGPESKRPIAEMLNGRITRFI
jgi:hypothetical protein